jgi:hypothetical protein
MRIEYIVPMKPDSTPESLLNQIAQIRRMDRGSIHVLREGPAGAYYNHQCYEQGRNISRYLPADQVADLKEAIEGYQRFEQLSAQYAALIVARTRAERAAGAKKKKSPRQSSSPATRKSSG